MKGHYVKIDLRDADEKFTEECMDAVKGNPILEVFKIKDDEREGLIVKCRGADSNDLIGIMSQLGMVLCGDVEFVPEELVVDVTMSIVGDQIKKLLGGGNGA